MITDTREERIISLLIDWGYVLSRRSDYGQIARATGQINCSSLAHVMRDGIEQMETVEHRRRLQVYPDRALDAVDSIVGAMPKKIKKAIVARYRWSDRIDEKIKVERLGVAKQTYYNRINKGHEILDRDMDWGMIY